MCKVFKEKKTGHTIIMNDETKLVFAHFHIRRCLASHCSDILKNQYVIEYDKGFYSFFLKKQLVLRISSEKFDRPIII